MKKTTIQEELLRYRQINNYAKKMILEQGAPEEDPNAPPPPPPADAGAPPAGGAPMPPLDDAGAPPPPEGGLPPVDAGAPPTDAATPPEGAPPAEGGGVDIPDTTEELDITDLVNMTKSIKKDLESKTDNAGEVMAKMDDVFTKLNDLETKLAEMDRLVNSIEELGYKVEQMKEPTPVEKLEMRSLDSYPFNKNPQQFFDEKRGEMQRSGKNTYDITPDDVSEYSKETITKTFNPYRDEEKQNNFSYPSSVRH